MTDLSNVVPGFPTREFNHLLPSLEKALITTTDLLTLEPSEIARRARIPAAETRRLVQHAVTLLRRELQPQTWRSRSTPQFISTLDATLDDALGGGFPTGHIVEVAGERYDAPASTRHT